MNSSLSPNRFLSVALAAAGLWAAAVLPLNVQAAEAKIGVINLKKVFDGYYKTKQADTQLKERAADFDKNRKGMRDDYDKAKEEFTKLRDAANDQALSADERDKRRASAQKQLEEIAQIEKDIENFDRTARSTLMEQQRRMRDRILDEIRELISQKAKEQGLQMVLDSAAETANQTPLVLYSTWQPDLTEPVLNELNSRGPLELAPTTDKKDEPKELKATEKK